MDTSVCSRMNLRSGEKSLLLQHDKQQFLIINCDYGEDSIHPQMVDHSYFFISLLLSIRP